MRVALVGFRPTNNWRPARSPLSTISWQGTASALKLEIARGLSLSDASSPLLYTKARFDSKTYPWIEKNHSAFSIEHPLVFSNDFADNCLAEKCIGITKERIDKLSKRINMDWLRVNGNHIYKTDDETLSEEQFKSVRRIKNALLPQDIILKGMPNPGSGLYDPHDLIIKNNTKERRRIVIGFESAIGGNQLDKLSGNEVAFGKRSTLLEPGDEKTIKIETSIDRGKTVILIHTDLNTNNKDYTQNYSQRTIIFQREKFFGGKKPKEVTMVIETVCALPQYKEALKDSYNWSSVECYYSSGPISDELEYVADFSANNFIIKNVKVTPGGPTTLEAEIVLKIVLNKK
ncbi:MAG: hypothetical protein IAF38_02220 [Bacteroidia bacterium]|nr:hypothetical protein [Bacteroidia bacterium]